MRIRACAHTHAGAELQITEGPSGEPVFHWSKCRLMGDILVLDDMVSDDSDR